MNRPNELRTDKDGKVVYGYTIKCDNFGDIGNYYFLPASVEAAFDTWAAKGINDGAFDDYRPGGMMYELIFSRSSVN
jgi:hypothetical protein